MTTQCTLFFSNLNFCSCRFDSSIPTPFLSDYFLCTFLHSASSTVSFPRPLIQRQMILPKLCHFGTPLLLKIFIRLLINKFYSWCAWDCVTLRFFFFWVALLALFPRFFIIILLILEGLKNNVSHCLLIIIVTSLNSFNSFLFWYSWKILLII